VATLAVAMPHFATALPLQQRAIGAIVKTGRGMLYYA
jgi:hypothetical protein